VGSKFEIPFRFGYAIHSFQFRWKSKY